MTQVRIHPIQGNGATTINVEDKLPSKSVYFKNRNGKPARVDHYAKVRLQNIYSDIDWVHYSRDGQWEFDFEVHPGGDPSVILLDYQGVESLAVDEDGTLLIHTPSGTLKQKPPVVFQWRHGRKQIIEGRYALFGNRQVGFQLGDYDSTQTLVIDPILEFSTLWGGSAFDDPLAMTTDTAGNLFLTGVTQSVDFQTAQAIDTTLSGNQDIFLLKLDVQQTLVTSTFIGGSGNNDRGQIITLAPNGDIYIGGETDSNDFPTTAGALDTTLGGFQDAIVLRLGPDGDSLKYATYLGGSAFDSATGIAVDTAGNIFLAGQTQSVDFPLASPLDSTLGGTDDGFIAKITPDGTGLIFSTFLGGAGNDLIEGLGIDTSGNVYVAGDTNSQDLPVTASALQSQFGGGAQDAFVARLNTAGTNLDYLTYFGGNGLDDTDMVTVDPQGNVYLTGETFSTNLTGTTGSFQSLPGGGNDCYASKFNANGSLAFLTFLGGSDDDECEGIAFDGNGNILVAGVTESTDFPVTGNAVQRQFGGGTSDAFVSWLSPTASRLVFSSYLGGSSRDVAEVTGVDGTGNIFVSGETESPDFPLRNALTSTAPGGQDIFIAKIDPANRPVGLDSSVLNRESSEQVIAPYWQADSGSYTFLALSHPSLTGMSSRIGVSVHAVLSDVSGQYGAPAEFTIASNATRQIFVAAFDNPSIHPGNLPDGQFITGSTNSSFGTLIVNPKSSDPNRVASDGGYNDITQLNFWGAVVIQDTLTGFAMEFIGDHQDSRAFNTENFSGLN